MRSDRGMHCRLKLPWQSASPDAENAEGQLPTEQVRTLGFNRMHGMISQQLFHKGLSYAGPV